MTGLGEVAAGEEFPLKVRAVDAMSACLSGAAAAQVPVCIYLLDAPASGAAAARVPVCIYL